MKLTKISKQYVYIYIYIYNLYTICYEISIQYTWRYPYNTPRYIYTPVYIYTNNVEIIWRGSPLFPSVYEYKCSSILSWSIFGFPCIFPNCTYVNFKLLRFNMQHRKFLFYHNILETKVTNFKFSFEKFTRVYI